MNKNWESKSPTPIGWVDYLDIWAKTKKSKFNDLDFLDSLQTTRKSRPRTRGAVSDRKSKPERATMRVQIHPNNFTFVTAGGRITCTQCQAKSKRTKQQCRAPASKGKTKCRFHGGASTGPKTPEGRQRCATAKTIHGNETYKARTERGTAMRQLRELEDLGHALGIMHGARTPGRKPV